MYLLRTADGRALPFSDSEYCGSPCTFESGSLSILDGDTVLVRETISFPPANGLPGLSSMTVGHFILRRVGERYAMEPGPDITLGRPVDTLTVRGDTLVVRATSPMSRYRERAYTP